MAIDLGTVTGRMEKSRSEDKQIQEYLSGRTILVTGAAGSIGQSIVCELQRLGIQHFIASDRNENDLHSLQLSIGGAALFDDPRIRLCDIRNLDSCMELFHDLKPEVVIHAAALKHLSALERQPHEAFLTNVVGTLNVILAANSIDVSTFINISTDKAADPTSVLGKSKRMAEELVSAVSSAPQKISVRFGNVFASKGSVIETFIYQINHGLTVTLTHPEVERYFMSATEAAYLVLASGSLGRSGIFVLDMGKPVLVKGVIDNLAKELGKEVLIEITGLRPGEKLKEVVYGNYETAKLTEIEGILEVASEGKDPVARKLLTQGTIGFLLEENTAPPALKVRSHSSAFEFFESLRFE